MADEQSDELSHADIAQTNEQQQSALQTEMVEEQKDDTQQPSSQHAETNEDKSHEDPEADSSRQGHTLADSGLQDDRQSKTEALDDLQKRESNRNVPNKQNDEVATADRAESAEEERRASQINVEDGSSVVPTKKTTRLGDEEFIGDKPPSGEAYSHTSPTNVEGSSGPLEALVKQQSTLDDHLPQETNPDGSLTSRDLESSEIQKSDATSHSQPDTRTPLMKVDKQDGSVTHDDTPSGEKLIEREGMAGHDDSDSVLIKYVALESHEESTPGIYKETISGARYHKVDAQTSQTGVVVTDVRGFTNLESQTPKDSQMPLSGDKAWKSHRNSERISLPDISGFERAQEVSVFPRLDEENFTRKHTMDIPSQIVIGTSPSGNLQGEVYSEMIVKNYIERYVKFILESAVISLCALPKTVFGSEPGDKTWEKSKVKPSFDAVMVKDDVERYVKSIIESTVISLSAAPQIAFESKSGDITWEKTEEPKPMMSDIDGVMDIEAHDLSPEPLVSTPQRPVHAGSVTFEDLDQAEDIPDGEPKRRKKKKKRAKKKSISEQDFTDLPDIHLKRPAKFEQNSTRQTYVPLPPLAQLPHYPKLAYPRKWGAPLLPAEPRTVLVGYTCPPVHRLRPDQLMTHAASTLRRYYNKPCIKAVEWIKVTGRR